MRIRYSIKACALAIAASELGVEIKFAANGDVVHRVSGWGSPKSDHEFMLGLLNLHLWEMNDGPTAWALFISPKFPVLRLLHAAKTRLKK